MTAEDILHSAELACRVRAPEGRMISSARITHFVADGVPLVDPIGVDCDRLGAPRRPVTVRETTNTGAKRMERAAPLTGRRARLKVSVDWFG